MIRKYWIIVLIAALLLAGFASTLLTSYFAAYRSLSEEISRNTLPLTSDNVYSEIQKDLTLSIFISSLMAQDTFVRDWVISGEDDAGKIIRYLSEIQKKYETVTSFFVSERTRNYYHPDGVLKQVSEDDPADKWYFRASAMTEPYEINIDTDTADRTRITIFVNYQVYGFGGELLGVTGVGLELSEVSSILNFYQEKYNSTVLFVDRSGNVILHADDFGYPMNLYSWDNFSGPAMKILTNPGSSLEQQIGESTYYVNSRFLPEFDLVLVILKEGDILKTRLKSKLIWNFAISILITSLIVLIVSFILKSYNKNIERTANIDLLTNACNRTVFSAIFSQTIKGNKRRNSPLSLIIIDIDRFKAVNDTCGHHCGDLVLKLFSDTVKGIIREADVLCRWGGEEFVLLLVDCPVHQASKVAEKIRKVISEMEIHLGKETVSITISAGVVEHREGETLSQLVDRADKLMYLAKEQGRNRVVSEE